jgi:hypothetical protein
MAQTHKAVRYASPKKRSRNQLHTPAVTKEVRDMARRADSLGRLLAASQQASSQAHRSFLKAEDRLAELEEREARRASRPTASTLERRR